MKTFCLVHYSVHPSLRDLRPFWPCKEGSGHYQEFITIGIIYGLGNILGSVLLELQQMKLVVLLQFSKFPCSTVYSLPVLLYRHSVELVSQARPNQPQRGWLGLLQLNWKLIPQDTFTQRYSPDLSSCGQKGLGSRLSGLSLFLENMNSAN